jgi:hypothetical protein
MTTWALRRICGPFSILVVLALALAGSACGARARADTRNAIACGAVRAYSVSDDQPLRADTAGGKVGALVVDLARHVPPATGAVGDAMANVRADSDALLAGTVPVTLLGDLAGLDDACQ